MSYRRLSWLNRSGQRAFGLIEALIALAILGAGLLAVVRMQMTVINSSSVSKQRTEATALCQKRVEELRSFVSLEKYDTYFGSSTVYEPPVEAVQGETALFQVRIRADDRRDDAIKGRYADLSANCVWSDSQGVERSVDLRSSISRVSPVDVGYLTQVTSAPPPPKCPAETVERAWTVAGATCRGLIVSQGDVGSIVTVGATTNTGTNQYICNSSGSWVEVATYSKTCTSICPPQPKTWTGANGESCVAQLLATASGGSVKAVDAVPNVTGDATFRCAATGSWELAAGSKCRAQCPETRLIWGGEKDVNLECAADFGPLLAPQQETRTVSSATPETTKRATYQCTTLGAWKLLSSECPDTCTMNIAGKKRTGELEIQIKLTGSNDSSFLTVCSSSKDTFECIGVAIVDGLGYTVRTVKKGSSAIEGKTATIPAAKCGGTYSGLDLSSK